MNPVIGGLIVGALGLTYGLLAGNEALHRSNPAFWKQFKNVGALVLLVAFVGLFVVPLAMSPESLGLGS
ncbi:hypothetical protein [Granulicoccus sp. GXG6511]|uniref:hypothetical protein n=1 Tax=Granulicoccus sp. GXG6511 TaxID=3381351 RepID=UPI003D7D0ECB